MRALLFMGPPAAPVTLSTRPVPGLTEPRKRCLGPSGYAKG